MPFIQFVSLPPSISMDPSQAAAEGRVDKWSRISMLPANADEYCVQFWDSSAPRAVSDFKLMSTFLSQGPLSLLPSMDNSSVKAAMVSYTDRFY